MAAGSLGPGAAADARSVQPGHYDVIQHTACGPPSLLMSGRWPTPRALQGVVADGNQNRLRRIASLAPELLREPWPTPSAVYRVRASASCVAQLARQATLATASAMSWYLEQSSLLSVLSAQAGSGSAKAGRSPARLHYRWLHLSRGWTSGPCAPIQCSAASRLTCCWL